MSCGNPGAPRRFELGSPVCFGRIRDWRAITRRNPVAATAPSTQAPRRGRWLPALVARHGGRREWATDRDRADPRRRRREELSEAVAGAHDPAAAKPLQEDVHGLVVAVRSTRARRAPRVSDGTDARAWLESHSERQPYAPRAPAPEAVLCRGSVAPCVTASHSGAAVLRGRRAGAAARDSRRWRFCPRPGRHGCQPGATHPRRTAAEREQRLFTRAWIVPQRSVPPAAAAAAAKGGSRIGADAPPWDALQARGRRRRGRRRA